MSSWINRNVPRKRDITQIPQELRPKIIPRVERPEVKMSESFQEIIQNTSYQFQPETEPKKSNLAKKKEVSFETNTKEYVTKKIDTSIKLNAIELKYDNKSYVFIILRHLRNVKDNDLWISSYNSIRKYYTNKIIIIDDNSQVNTVDGKLVNTEVIKSEFNGAGEVLPYYYFLKYKWADRMIFIHDSMFINRPFKETELNNQVKFHWYFDREEILDVNKLHFFISMLNNNTGIKGFITDSNNIWEGCFGGGSMIDLTIVENLEEKYNLFSNMVFSIKSRKERESFERLFGIILFYEKLITQPSSNFGNIIKYPGAFESQNNNIETAQYIVNQKNYNTAILKVWRGR